MPKYSKDINHIITREEVDQMISNCKIFRDKFLVAILYITGARIGELCMLERKDVKITPKGMDITLKTEKLGQDESFRIEERTLTILPSWPYYDIISKYVEYSRFDRLLNITTRRAEQILEEVSENRFCPNNFRHTRATKLSRSGATIDQLMYWKGSKDIRSVSPYLRAKKVVFDKME